MKDKGRHKIYEIESKWECLLWMKQHDFSEEKILYILNAPVVEDDPYRARYIPVDHIIQVLDSPLGDEFKHNEECFIRWYLSQSSDPKGLYYARHKFDTLYDWDTHQFDYDLSQFYRKELSSPDYRGKQKRILKFDKQKLYDLQFSRLGIFSYLREYLADTCDEITDSKINVHHDIRFKKIFYCEENTEEKLLSAYTLLGTNITASVKFDEMDISLAETGFIFITIVSGENVDVCCNNDNRVEINLRPVTKSVIMITPDEALYIRSENKYTNGKFRPLKMTQLYRLYKQKTPGVHAFFKYLLSYYQKKSLLLQDVLRDMDAAPMINIPFIFNDVVQYHNKKQYIVDNYKTAVQIPINWNKRNIVLSWLMIHSWNKLANDRSRQILIQSIDASILSCYNESGVELHGSLKGELINDFLANVITARIQKILSSEIDRRRKNGEACLDLDIGDVKTGCLDEEREEYLQNILGIRGEAFQIAKDYVNMSRRKNKRGICGKVNLDIKSYEQLRNRHDSFNEHEYYVNNTDAVSIPKNSKFNRLQELLTEDFEWIKTRKRLIIETELQHHCVWSYASAISKDKCAIYSYLDKSGAYGTTPRRYTIEFRFDSVLKRYYVVQVQGRYDQVNANNMRAYIQDILDRHQQDVAS